MSDISYVVHHGETLSSIREKFPYIPHWKVLAEYNHLEYPYIVDNSFVIKELASGTVRFARKAGFPVTPITIPSNTIISYDIYLYITKEEGFIGLPDTFSNNVVTEAIEYGEEYNLQINKIDTILDEDLQSILTVTNNTEVSGGLSKNVLYYGDVIKIPDTQSLSKKNVSISYNDIFGVDIYTDDHLSTDYGSVYMDSQNDIKLISGVDNLSQSLKRRVTTPKGSLPKHSNYGSRLPIYIGAAIHYDIPDLLKVELIDCLCADPRVESIENIVVTFVGDSADISCRIVTIFNVDIPLNFVLR